MSDEYAAVKRGKLILKGDKPKYVIEVMVVFVFKY